MKSSITMLGQCSWVFVLAAAIGCGEQGPKLVTVKGKVTVDGSEPLQKGEIRFHAKEGSNVRGGLAITDEEGNYTATHASQKPGLEPGDYLVSFSLIQMPDGSPLPDQAGEAYPKSPTELGGVQFVPKEYTVLSDKNTITVTDEGGSFDFDLPPLQTPAQTQAKK